MPSKPRDDMEMEFMGSFDWMDEYVYEGPKVDEDTHEDMPTEEEGGPHSDNRSVMTMGTQFIFKITCDELDKKSVFYYYFDVYLPFRSEGEKREQSKSSRVSGHGLIEAPTSKSLSEWEEILAAILDAKFNPADESTPGLVTKEVLFPADDYKRDEDSKRAFTSAGGAEADFKGKTRVVVHGMPLEDQAQFLQQFRKEAGHVVTSHKLRHLVGKTPHEIVEMVPQDKLIKCFERLSTVVGKVDEASVEEGAPLDSDKA